MGKLFDRMRKSVKKRVHPHCAAIVPAAGKSTRMDGEDKMLAQLCGAPVLTRTLSVLDRAVLVEGGASRAESVLLAALEASPDTEYLAVHDGARPLILPEQVDEMIRLGQRTYAVAPALPVTDTVKVADMAGLVLSTPDRSTLFAVQTPQVFQANILKAALQSALAAGAALTDDCSAVERLGKEVYLTPGWRENIKITTPEDLSVAEAFLRRRGDAQ